MRLTRFSAELYGSGQPIQCLPISYFVHGCSPNIRCSMCRSIFFVWPSFRSVHTRFSLSLLTAALNEMYAPCNRMFTRRPASASIVCGQNDAKMPRSLIEKCIATDRSSFIIIIRGTGHVALQKLHIFVDPNVCTWCSHTNGSSGTSYTSTATT